VTLADFRDYGRVINGERAAALATSGRRALIIDERLHPLVAGTPTPVVYETGVIGLAGAAAGDDVYVLDRLGLGDAYAARQEIETRRRPGHDKPLPIAWVWGRYGVVSDTPPQVVADARAARVAMACAPLRDLREAITAPLTARRIVRNIAAAPGLTLLRFPADPRTAATALCGAQPVRGDHPPPPVGISAAPRRSAPGGPR
jgi:arabinofuranosyltransferase